MKHSHIVERINARRRLHHLVRDAKPYFWLLAAIACVSLVAYLVDPPKADAATVASDDAGTLAACMNGAYIAVGDSVMTCSITHYKLIGGI